MYCKKQEIMGHIVVVKVTRNKTVLSVFINVNPNGLLTIKVANINQYLYILSQTYIATRLGSDFFCTRDQLV